jgi:hypothetical protein
VLVAKRNNIEALAAELLGAIDLQIQDFEAPTVMFVDEAPRATK